MGWEKVARIDVLGGETKGSVYDVILRVLHRVHGSESGRRTTENELVATNTAC